MHDKATQDKTRSEDKTRQLQDRQDSYKTATNNHETRQTNSNYKTRQHKTTIKQDSHKTRQQDNHKARQNKDTTIGKCRRKEEQTVQKMQDVQDSKTHTQRGRGNKDVLTRRPVLLCVAVS
jgi:hypothetical protein